MADSPEQFGSWEVRTIVRNMFPLLVVLSGIVLVAGITLEGAQDLLDQYGVLAVMVPTMVGLGGNLGSILSARLTTRFHLGMTEIDPRDRQLWANVGAILALALTVFTVLAVAAWGIGIVLGSYLPLSTLLFISLVSGLSLAVIAIAFGFAATYASYRLGIDPDDTTIPIVTNVVDVCGMMIFIGVSSLVLGS